MTAVATTTAARPVMQTRLDAAIKRLATKVGQKEVGTTGLIIVETPKPKSATGTADRVRKDLASGHLTGLPEGYAVKSRLNQVVVVKAEMFHPWDRAAIAARKADTAKPTKKVRNAAVIGEDANGNAIRQTLKKSTKSVKKPESATAKRVRQTAKAQKLIAQNAEPVTA